MVHYYIDRKGKRTIAVLKNCRFDAVKRIAKLINNRNFDFYQEKYLMPNQFRVIVKCNDYDEYDVDMGMKIAKAELMEKYYNALDKRIEMFKDELSVVMDSVFETFAC